MRKYTRPSGAVGCNGVTVLDCGSYFRVIDGPETSTIPKSYNGFQTPGELLAYLTRGRGGDCSERNEGNNGL